MIDLRSILKQNPSCLNSRATFKSVLLDKYPSEKRMVNVLTILFECGVTSKIKAKKIISTNDMQGLLTQVENEYGLPAKYTQDAILIWAAAFDVTVQSVLIQNVSESLQEPIGLDSHDTIVIGSKSDYETQITNSGHLIIKKYIGFDERTITIPSQIDGLSVQIIGEGAFSNCTGIENIIVPEGITEIRNRAFHGCSSLKTVHLPTTLKKIGTPVASPFEDPFADFSDFATCGAFGECSIEEIQLPSSLSYIGPSTFLDCRKLRRISLPNKIKTISSDCFCLCTSLSDVILPDSLIEIERDAFSCSGLAKINIPSSVSKISSCAFCGCEKLSSVILHEGLKSIADSAFENCNMLQEIMIPQSVTSIDKTAFDIRDDYNGSLNRRKRLVISCYAGSYALSYARTQGYQIKNAAKQQK